MNIKKLSLDKYEKYGLIFMAIINGLFANLDTVNTSVKIFRAISGFAMGSIIMIMVVHFLKKDIDRKALTMKLSVLGIIWSLSFIAMNVLEKGSIISVLNTGAVTVLALNIIGLIKEKNKLSEEDPIKFGYIWVGCVLLIPFLVIGVLLGY